MRIKVLAKVDKLEKKPKNTDCLCSQNRII
jgi:hypothetical protein